MIMTGGLILHTSLCVNSHIRSRRDVYPANLKMLASCVEMCNKLRDRIPIDFCSVAMGNTLMYKMKKTRKKLRFVEFAILKYQNKIKNKNIKINFYVRETTCVRSNRNLGLKTSFKTRLLWLYSFVWRFLRKHVIYVLQNLLSSPNRRSLNFQDDWCINIEL